MHKAFQAQDFTQLAQPAVGRKWRFFGGQDDLIENNLLKYKGHKGQNMIMAAMDRSRCHRITSRCSRKDISPSFFVLILNLDKGCAK